MKRIFISFLLLFSAQAYGWTATFLGGNNWAVTCANGTSWSYNGSSAGLDTVGPALCPGGLIAPNIPRRTRVEAGIANTVNVDVLKNRQETTEDGVQRIRTYPPHGYPCLGCEPCPDGSGDFCDIANLRRVVVTPGRSNVLLGY